LGHAFEAVQAGGPETEQRGNGSLLVGVARLAGKVFLFKDSSQMEADAYADSSFLVSLLRVDDNHEAAMRYMAQSGETLAFNPLHRVELRNALRNAQALGQITENERRLAFREIEQDLQAGLLIHTRVNWTDAFRVERQTRREGGATHN
jgi:predicted nucleic acid-binding protein